MKHSIIAAIVIATVSTAAFAGNAENTARTAGHSHDKGMSEAKKTGNGLSGSKHVGGMAAYSSSHHDAISSIYGDVGQSDITDPESQRAYVEQQHAIAMQHAYDTGREQMRIQLERRDNQYSDYARNLAANKYNSDLRAQVGTATPAVTTEHQVLKGDYEVITGNALPPKVEAPVGSYGTIVGEQGAHVVDGAIPQAVPYQVPAKPVELTPNAIPQAKPYQVPTPRVDLGTPNMVPVAVPYQVPAKPVMNVPHAVPQATPYQVPAQPTMKTPNMVPVAVPYQVPTPIVDLGTPVQVGKVPSVIKHPTQVVDNGGSSDIVFVPVTKYCSDINPKICYDNGVQSIKDIVAKHGK